ncbi:hypothetical protein CLU96_2312 [Chryseobacterium sp. 52]|uniref:hypothetical protein n=1 Tax=Chryseobacterium sp. 52 TaxID=2035213 RepID=UPI000C65F442|nr:hypothetical protein [Chryseobacterium sp. 52]PIF45310.1 hypothetical protein CLU96_2312 [Chryseobacterium sp. 52]
MKKITLMLFGLTLCMGLIISLSSFRNSYKLTDTTVATYFEHEEVQTITCGLVTWSKTTFRNASGSIVGTTEMKNGSVTASYTGTYTSSVTESGTIPEREGKMIDCIGWGVGCRRVTAQQACE